MIRPSVSYLFALSLVPLLISCSSGVSTEASSAVEVDGAQLTEFQNLAMGLKGSVDFASTEIIETVDDLDGGYLGIPDNIPRTSTSHGSAVENGVITVTWRNDGSPLAGLTYILSAQNFNYPITWSESGSCFTRDLCTSRLNP